jgi:hypothetical protein
MIQREHFGWSAGWERLKTLFTSSKKALIAAPFLLGIFLSVLPVQSASAASPTLRWINDSSVEISGAPLKQSYTVTTQANVDPSTGLVWSGSTEVQLNTGDCWLSFAIGIPKPASGASPDYSKALVWPNSAPSGDKPNCNGPGKDNSMGFANGQLYTVANVENRSNSGDPIPPAQVDDPEDQQVINVKLEPGWSTVYTTPNPSNPPKDSELVPKEDLWILCGNASDPTKSWDPYRNANTGTPNYDQMKTDCINRRSGWVISTARGPMQTDPIRYEGKFTGVRWGDYVICDFITNSCVTEHKEPGKVLNLSNWPGTANPTAQVPGAETDTDGTVEEPELGCDLTFDLTTIFSLKWLVCPVIDTATFAVGKLEDAINDLLTVGVKDIFDDTAGDNAFHKAWNSFRFFAIGLIVIAALIMVVSQAAGVEILDAYTVRKVLPRLLFAAIFIALSWDVLEFLVQLSNDAGLGVRTLIYAPFQALNTDNQLGGGSTAVLALIGTGGALAFGWIGLLSFAVTGLLAALVAFAILVFRKMLILLLVMMAPFAIAAYVLPNTNKLWDIWKGGLLSVLIVFPIISSMIAIGRVFAITSLSAPGNKIINQLIAIVAYFAPYFMISMAFRLAGGFIATVGGFVNDRSKGAFDRLKNFRSNKVNENMNKMATGQRFQGSNPMARAFNATTFGASTFAKSRSKLGFLTNGGVRSAAFEQQRSLNAMAYAKSDAAQVAQHNDDLLRAQTYANEATARRNMANDFGMSAQAVEAAVGAARANGGFGRDQQVNAVNRLFNTGTGWDNQRQASEAIARVAGGNRNLAAAMIGAGNGVTDKVGRSDLKIGFGEYLNLYDEQTQADAPLGDDRFARATMQAVLGNDAVSMARGKPRAMGNVMPVLAEALQRAQQTAATPGDFRDNNGQIIYDDQGRTMQEQARAEMGRLTGVVEQYQNAGMYSSPVNITHVQEGAVAPTVNITQEVRQSAGEFTPTYDPNTGQRTGRTPNLNRDPNVEAGYNQQHPRSMYDPNDPNRQP